MVLPLLGLGIEVVVTPQLLHHLSAVDTELGGVDLGEVSDGEGPAEESGTHGAGAHLRVDLEALAHAVVLVRRNNDVDALDDTEEVLVHVLTVDLELEDGAVDLVDDQDRLDFLTESLTQHGLGLDGDALDVVDDDERTVGDTKGGGNLRREVNVTRRVDKVDQVTKLVLLVDDIGLVVEGNTGGLDGDTTFLFVLTGVSGAGISSCLLGNNAGLGDEGVGQGALAVVDVSNDGHVSDLVSLVLTLSELVNGEVGHDFWQRNEEKNN